MPTNELQAAMSWWRMLSSHQQEQFFEDYQFTTKKEITFWQFKSNSYEIAKLWRLKGRPEVNNV